MNFRINIFLISILFCLPKNIHAQNKKIDSLKAIFLNNTTPDSIKLQSLNDLIWPLYSNSAPDSGIKYGHIAIALAKKNNYLNKLTVSYRRIGICYTNIGNYKFGLYYHNESLELAKKINNTKDIGIALGNIGVVYMDIGDQTKALDYNLQSIDLKESIKDYSTIQNNYFNVGILYKDMGELDKALIAMEKSVKIAKIIKNYTSLGSAYNGMGLIYKAKKDYVKARYYYNKAIENNVVHENNHELSDSYVNVGSLFIDLKNYDSAAYYLRKGGEVSKKINYKSGVSAAISNLSFCDIKLKKYNEAIKYAYSSIAENENSLGNKEYCYGLLSDAYDSIGNYKNALKFHILRGKLNDSLLKINQNRDLIKIQIQNDFDKKILADSIKFSNQEKITLAKVEAANAKLDKEKTTRYALIIGLICLAIFAYFIFTRFQLIKKQNIIIDQQKKETENQKKLLEIKQKEILDSIHYAKRIQTALMSSENYITKNIDRLTNDKKNKD